MGKSALMRFPKNQELRGDYTKSAAFADALGASSLSLLKVLKARCLLSQQVLMLQVLVGRSYECANKLKLLLRMLLVMLLS